MVNRYQGIPEAAIPPIGTDSRRALDLMIGDEPAQRSKLIAIDDNIRRLLQPLEGEQYGYWVIDRIHEGGSRKATHFKINGVHFVSESDDLKARLGRKLVFKEKSHKQAKSETKRLAKAQKEFADTLVEMENAQQN